MLIIKKFLSKKRKQKKIFILTLFYITYTQLLIISIPFKFIIKILSLKKIEVLDKNISNENNLKEIIWAINICSKIVFWKSKCLNQALTVYKVSKIYGNKPYLYLGLIKENNEIQAHAWVKINEKYIIGKDNRIYNIISIFE